METTCCVAGGGPAGVMLSLLLARQKVPVVLLEMHKNFDRDFRGDTLHPSVLEILDEVGLAESLLRLPHTKAPRLLFVTSEERIRFIDLSRLRTRFPYTMLIPQARFLEFVAAEAAKIPEFRLVMQANVQELIEEEGEIRGVRYIGPDGATQEVRALLTVGADGRFSRVRRLAGIEPVKQSPPMDVLWFRLPRGGELEPAALYFGRGEFLILLDRGEYWQAGYVIPKGSYQRLRAGGPEALRAAVARLAPPLAGSAAQLKDWNEVSLLSVESSRVPRWFRPGLLLIGDAAHVMSPVGGVGINYAIQDAVAAANLLGWKLKRRDVSVTDLARVQQRRERPVRLIQAVQGFIQEKVALAALAHPEQPFRLPPLMGTISRVPWLRDLPGWVIGLGYGREHVRS